jgi:gamma-glutamyl phosphate reductase
MGAARDLERVQWAEGALKEAGAIQAQATLIRQQQDELLKANTKDCQTESSEDVDKKMAELQVLQLIQYKIKIF